MPDEEGHPELAEMSLGPVLSALADPLRRKIIRELSLSDEGTERTCASFNLPVSKATLTHHFRVLREAGLIRQINRGNSRAAALRRSDLQTKFPGLLDLLADEQADTQRP